jgi:hypothetical protein
VVKNKFPKIWRLVSEKGEYYDRIFPFIVSFHILAKFLETKQQKKKGEKISADTAKARCVMG